MLGTKGESYGIANAEALPPSEAYCQFKRLEMGYNLFTQILILPTPRGFYVVSFIVYLFLPTASYHPKAWLNHLPIITCLHAKQSKEVPFIPGTFNVMSSEITSRADISSFLLFVVLLFLQWLCFCTIVYTAQVLSI